MIIVLHAQAHRMFRKSYMWPGSSKFDVESNNRDYNAIRASPGAQNFTPPVYCPSISINTPHTRVRTTFTATRTLWMKHYPTNCEFPLYPQWADRAIHHMWRFSVVGSASGVVEWILWTGKCRGGWIRGSRHGSRLRMRDNLKQYFRVDGFVRRMSDVVVVPK